MRRSKTWSQFRDSEVNTRSLHFEHGMCNSLDRDAYCPMHSHPVIEIVYHPTGVGVTRNESREELHFQDGSVVIYPPYYPHEQVMKTEGEDFCIQIAPPAKKRGFPDSWLYVPYLDNRCVREEIQVLSQRWPRPNQSEQAIHDLRATAILFELIQLAAVQHAYNSAETGEQHVRNAERYIRENFSTIGSLPSVADFLGINYHYLRHEFRIRRGITLIRHLNEVRIERAKTLLQHSNLPLKQVATMCGFKDKYYFSAVFQKHMKTSPGSYRRAEGEVIGSL